MANCGGKLVKGLHGVQLPVAQQDRMRANEKKAQVERKLGRYGALVCCSIAHHLGVLERDSESGRNDRCLEGLGRVCFTHPNEPSAFPLQRPLGSSYGPVR